MTPLDRGSEIARFMAATYISDVRFSYLPGFAGQVREEIAAKASSAADLLEILTTATEMVDTERVLATDCDARRQVEARDLRTIRDSITANDLESADFSPEWIHAQVVTTCEQAVEILANHALPIDKPPEVFVVDRMPAPYDRRSSIAALAIDSADEAEYGIAQGIYFQRSQLMPYYSQFIALHEMLHVLLGRTDPHRTAHGLEEGLGDVLGSIWLSQMILGSRLTRRLFVLNRLSSKYLPYWERYLDSARQAFARILIFGLEETLKLVHTGRVELYEVERSLLRTPRVRVHADLRDDFTSLAWELLFTYPRSFVCSPAAYLFAREARSGLTVREVAARARLAPEIATRASRELRDEHGAVFLRRDELVIIEGTPASILSQDWFRYDSE
jgi:hypothetical protein